jgi:SulP family sulfate permease
MVSTGKRAGKATLRRVRSLKTRITQKLSFTTLQVESLAGITVALALIPESLAFAAIAKVSPMVALYTSFSMAVVIALAGGRPAMISAATGSMALLMTTLVAKHGVEYLFAATILTGVIQFLIGIFKLGRFFSFIPQTVIAGFVNALGILIFVAQVQQLPGEPWQAYAMVAATLAIVYLFPRLNKSVPSPLVAIVAMTVVAITAHLPIRRVGDIGEITRNLPMIHLPQVSVSLETLAIILPYAVTLAIVGLLESLLTAALLDDLTDTRSSKDKEVRGTRHCQRGHRLFGRDGRLWHGWAVHHQRAIGGSSSAINRCCWCVSAVFDLCTTGCCTADSNGCTHWRDDHGVV